MPAISRGEVRGGEVGSTALVLLSALKLVLVAIHTAVLAPVVVAVALFDQRAAYRICQLWVRLNLLIYALRVRTTRLAPLDPSAAYVFMSNHRSQFDILAVITALFDFQLRWVAKVELTRVPNSTDLLGCYVVALDGDGELVGYERVRRYQRGQVGGDEQ